MIQKHFKKLKKLIKKPKLELDLEGRLKYAKDTFLADVKEVKKDAKESFDTMLKDTLPFN